MASDVATNSGLTATSSEASLPVDGKGWVDRLSQQADAIANDIQELLSRSASTPEMQQVLDQLTTLKSKVIFHVRTNDLRNPTA